MKNENAKKMSVHVKEKYDLRILICNVLII